MTFARNVFPVMISCPLGSAARTENWLKPVSATWCWSGKRVDSQSRHAMWEPIPNQPSGSQHQSPLRPSHTAVPATLFGIPVSFLLWNIRGPEDWYTHKIPEEYANVICTRCRDTNVYATGKGQRESWDLDWKEWWREIGRNTHNLK